MALGPCDAEPKDVLLTPRHGVPILAVHLRRCHNRGPTTAHSVSGSETLTGMHCSPSDSDRVTGQ